MIEEMHFLRHSSAALLLVVVAAVSVLPFAAAGAEHRGGCHCVVRMDCCEDGTCPMGGPEPPATGLEWRTCRREAPATTPIDAFDGALPESTPGSNFETSAPIAAMSPDRTHLASPIPTTPPPRFLSF